MAVAPGVLSELGGSAAAHLAGRCPSVALDAGDEWCPAGSSEVALLAIDAGFVLVSADGQRGNGSDHRRRIVVATGQQGMLLPSLSHEERLEAVTASRISIVAPESFRDLLRLPLAAEAIAVALTEALMHRQTSIRNCTYVRHSERVRQTLLQLAGMYGRVVTRGVRIDFPLTHQLLADMVGSARETVSLAVAEFTREGFVEREQRRYVVRVGPHELGS